MNRNVLTSNAKIAILNRGEAAVRFIRAAKEYNTLHETHFESVALYIDVEADALFVKEADHAFALSQFNHFDSVQGSPYLDAEFIIKALKSSKCEAVWVGWGFLAEDSHFASLLEQNNILLLGPSSGAMELLGDKIKAKELADNTKVPTTPWSGRPLKDLEDARAIAKKIGYPVILKSANGGGGRGIRKIFTEDDLEQGFHSVSEEIFRFFGNKIIFMEALVARGRHLEVQCVADYFGNVLTFGVRDCSVQRNNQKIIEETPPANFPEDTIKELEEASARLLKASNYHGAGTVEYLYDLDRKEFFFMEVNTRLQVEHPISEELYHTDLVQLQLEVGRGKDLSSFKKEPPIGHVIEIRLNAEDPDNNFAPTPGKIKRYLPPQLPGIRIDAGIEWGSTIPKEFDSMIAKIIARGSDRKSALAKLTRALKELQIEIDNGTTNQGFLLELFATQEVKDGGVQTSFVETYLEESRSDVKPHWDIAVIAAAIYQYEERFENHFENFVEKIRRFSLPRNIAKMGSQIQLNHEEHKYEFNIRSVGNNVIHIEAEDQDLVAEYVNWGNEIVLKTKQSKHKVQIVPRASSLQCEVDGVPYVLPLDAAGTISAPSPSVVLSVLVEPGQEVKKGELLLTLEAMKMEMTVSAPEDGLISKVMVRAGEQVAAGQKLVDMESLSEEGEEQASTESERLTFNNLAIANSGDEHEVDAKWNFLAREYQAVFTGFDYTQPVGQILNRLEKFTEEHPKYKPALGKLIVDGCLSFITINQLFSSDQQAEGKSRESAFDECLMHYFLRKEDREAGLPEPFLERLEAAINLYPWAELSNHNDTSLALFHIYQSYANLSDKVELARLSLFALQNLQETIASVCNLDDLSQLLNGLIQNAGNNWVLVDAATHTRYELIEKRVQIEKHSQHQATVAQLLNSVLDKKDVATSETEVIESGHQISSHLISLTEDNPEKAEKILELVSKRFNRDRTFDRHSFITQGDLKFCYVESHSPSEDFDTITTIVDEDQFLNSLDHVNAVAEQINKDNLEVTIILRKTSDTPEYKLVAHLESTPIKAKLCCFGLYSGEQYNYHSFEYNEEGRWQESVRRRYFSPLRYREMRIDRLKEFDVELVYHTRLVHVLKLEAKDNNRDQRIFAFVEIPETEIVLDDSQEISRISNFEIGMLEAAQAIREQQAKQKRLFFWNRIIVHIGQTHPLKLEQVGEYPRKVSNLLHGLHLEKVTIYTKVAGRRRNMISAEVMVENLHTQYTTRGRLPSKRPLQSLDPYTSKVVRSLRRSSPYPYEIVGMLTDTASESFPEGKFEEFDISFDSNGNQETVSVAGRPYGNNISNVVFGKISNRFTEDLEFERVLLLGDPSRDLGSLAEEECRRVIAAIDLAEHENIPVEWIPISSGANIDMETGTENLDWTARVLKRIVDFTQAGGEINIIVSGINVGAQSYWNAEATMLQHTRGLLIMTDEGSMVLTGKKALDFSGSVSAEDNIGIGGAEKIMAPNGQSQFRVKDLASAYRLLFKHYKLFYSSHKVVYGMRRQMTDKVERDVCQHPYEDRLNQGFTNIGDILGPKNQERKKPFDMRQIMGAVKDLDADYLERWHNMKDAETAIVWETLLGGFPVGMIGIESQPVKRFGDIPNDGPDSWTGGTLYPNSSKKVSRAINSFSGKVPVVVLANLSGFDGSPESLRKLQLEYGAEIGRAVVNFEGPLVFVVVSRYHGGAYVVFSKTLNPNMKVLALENTFASVIGGAPAAAVVFPRQVLKNTFDDPQIVTAQEQLKAGGIQRSEYDDLFQKIHLEHQAKLAQKFEKIHSVERALKVGSIDDIISANELRPYLVNTLETEINKFTF